MAPACVEVDAGFFQLDSVRCLEILFFIQVFQLNCFVRNGCPVLPGVVVGGGAWLLFLGAPLWPVSCLGLDCQVGWGTLAGACF